MKAVRLEVNLDLDDELGADSDEHIAQCVKTVLDAHFNNESEQFVTVQSVLITKTGVRK